MTRSSWTPPSKSPFRRCTRDFHASEHGRPPGGRACEHQAGLMATRAWLRKGGLRCRCGGSSSLCFATKPDLRRNPGRQAHRRIRAVGAITKGARSEQNYRWPSRLHDSFPRRLQHRLEPSKTASRRYFSGRRGETTCGSVSFRYGFFADQAPRFSPKGIATAATASRSIV